MNTDQKTITLTFKKSAAKQAVLLPQADLLRGVAGSVLAVQLGEVVFAVDMASVVQQLASETSVQAPFASSIAEEKGNLVNEEA